jgi:hypothetical protein
MFHRQLERYITLLNNILIMIVFAVGLGTISSTFFAMFGMPLNLITAYVSPIIIGIYIVFSKFYDDIGTTNSR